MLERFRDEGLNIAIGEDSVRYHLVILQRVREK